jgi:chloride channel 7
MGICGGLIGAMFNFINFKVSVFRRRFVRHKVLRVLEPLLVVSLVVTFGMLLSMAVSECHPNGYVAQIRSVQMRCPDGHYNAMASLFVATSEESIRTLFHAQPGWSFNDYTLCS